MMTDDDEDLAIDAEDEGPNLRGRVLQICEDLHEDDMESLKFLCSDKISNSKLERIKQPHELFQLWQKTFAKRYEAYIAESLYRIQRIDLLEDYLCVEESVVEDRIDNGDTLIPAYMVMLFNIAEDLDSDDLHKMLFLTGDMKKKDREKVKNTLTFLSFLVKTKTITQDNLEKLKEMLKQISRNDLVDTIIHYENSMGIVSSKDEPMETSEFNSIHEPRLKFSSDQQQKKQQSPQVHPTHREHLIPQSCPEPPGGQRSPGQFGQRVEHNDVTVQPALSSSDREVEISGSSKSKKEERGMKAEYPPEDTPVQTQNVIPDTMLRQITQEISQSLDDSVWVVFGNRLKVSPGTLQQLGRQYPLLRERIYHLLNLWLNNLPGGYDSAMKCIIDALHETQVHHLAERFSKIYPNSENTGMRETGDISLSSTTLGSSGHENISVHTGEAQYHQPQPQLQQQALQQADAEGGPQTSMPAPQLQRGVSSNTSTQTGMEPSVHTIGAVSAVPDEIPYYKMDRKPRGLCMIINNENFFGSRSERGNHEMPDRQGSSVDAENLRRTFENLGFFVIPYNNLSGPDMVRQCVNIAFNQDHANYDCFVSCVLSHGIQGHVYGSDGRLVSINDLTHPFKPLNCATLANKPKLFFIQACQGREKQMGQEIECDAPEPVDRQVDMPREVIPNEADFLIGYATVPGFVSYRSRTHGSWYITKLCDMLNMYGTRYDLLSVLLMVNYEVGRANAKMETGLYKQAPAPLYTLRKKVLFR